MIAPLRDDLAFPVEIIKQPSLVYGYITVADDSGENKSRINGYIDELDAVRQAVFHIVYTERGYYQIYDLDYGIEAKQLINKSYNYFRIRIEQIVQDALYQDDRITDVRLINTEQIDHKSARAFFGIQTIYGNMQEHFDIPLL